MEELRKYWREKQKLCRLKQRGEPRKKKSAEEKRERERLKKAEQRRRKNPTSYKDTSREDFLERMLLDGMTRDDIDYRDGDEKLWAKFERRLRNV